MVENQNTFYFYISPLRMESVQTADLDNRESNKVNIKKTSDSSRDERASGWESRQTVFGLNKWSAFQPDAPELTLGIENLTP